MKYFNINGIEEEVDRRPDIVRLYANDEKCLEFVRIDILDEIIEEITELEEELFHEPHADYKAYAAVRNCLDIINKHLGKEHGDEE